MPGFSLQIVADTFTPKLIKATPLIKQAISDELESAGVEMEAQAREIVPVDTGFLQSTICHSAKDLTLELGATADYSSFVEFGTRRMAAQPYIRPAFDAGQKQFLQALLQGILRAFA